MYKPIRRKRIICAVVALVIGMFWPVNFWLGIYNAYGPPGREAIGTVRSLYETARQRREVSPILAQLDLKSLQEDYGPIESFQVTNRRPTWADWIVVVSVDVRRSKANTRERAEVWIPGRSQKFPQFVSRVKLGSVLASR
jgi:hypothetical protein